MEGGQESNHPPSTKPVDALSSLPDEEKVKVLDYLKSALDLQKI